MILFSLCSYLLLICIAKILFRSKEEILKRNYFVCEFSWYANGPAVFISRIGTCVADINVMFIARTINEYRLTTNHPSSNRMYRLLSRRQRLRPQKLISSFPNLHIPREIYIIYGLISLSLPQLSLSLSLDIYPL